MSAQPFQQMDLIRHSDAALAKANRVAAQSALTNPFFTPEQAQQRHDYYMAEAARFERSPK